MGNAKWVNALNNSVSVGVLAVKKLSIINSSANTHPATLRARPSLRLWRKEGRANHYFLSFLNSEPAFHCGKLVSKARRLPIWNISATSSKPPSKFQVASY
jgi:hypothetical protein